jgi:hypothetical protein
MLTKEFISRKPKGKNSDKTPLADPASFQSFKHFEAYDGIAK